MTVRWASSVASAVIAVGALAGCSGGDQEPVPAESSWPDGSSTATNTNPTSDVSSSQAGGSGQGASPGGGAPTGGATESVPREEKPPVAVEDEAEFGDGMKVTIASTEAVTMSDVLPGEIAGPAVAIRLAFQNTGSADVSLQNVIVSVNYAGQEASSFTGEPAAAPPESVAAGQTAEGVYVFAIPQDQRADVTVRVSYSPTAAQVTFTGPVG